MVQTLELLPTKEYEAVKAGTLSKSNLIELWDLGLINATGYIAAALLMEGDDRDLDIEAFCLRWRGVPDHQTNKVKTVKPKQVKLALIALEEKGAIEVPDKPIQLRLNFGG
ncbi:hypothetical protein H6F86_21135 [Phormidium sp. FACHB-592]|uniref:Uncharacterized protein n=1 Tax=Stenomitos frigidus AS-A4 TaxID=2933935 RepID=A0ABV0KES0_9CYAN|nr:hypothetical protein [Phormidium sp. FACHB-592]MBD2076340.1 hypothetical protein [Phormidium sp. FACHB-592]